MSFNYPTLHAKGPKDVSGLGGSLEQEHVNLHGLSNALQSGLSTVSRSRSDVHPLELSERYHDDQQDRINYAMLRATQGIHAPLRLQMEKFLVKQTFRHSVLPSTNLHLEVLDVPEYWEKEVHPHVILESKTEMM